MVSWRVASFDWVLSRRAVPGGVFVFILARGWLGAEEGDVVFLAHLQSRRAVTGCLVQYIVALLRGDLSESLHVAMRGRVSKRRPVSAAGWPAERLYHLKCDVANAPILTRRGVSFHFVWFFYVSLFPLATRIYKAQWKYGILS